MSESGQSLSKCDARDMSGLPSTAAEQRTSRDVSNVPISDIAGRPQVKEANTRRPYYAGWASDDARVAV